MAFHHHFNEKDSVFLDSRGDRPVAPTYSYIACDPVYTITSRDGVTSIYCDHKTETYTGDAYNILKQFVKSFDNPKGGIFGFLGYEFSVGLNGSVGAIRESPLQLDSYDYCFIVPRLLIIYDHHAKKMTINVLVLDQFKIDHVAYFKNIIGRLHERVHHGRPPVAPTIIKSKFIGSNFSFSRYLKTIETAKNYIREGDSYQIKLSQRLKFNFDGDPLSLYSDIRKINPSPFSAFINFNKIKLLSCSPENLLEVKNGIALTRPIGGTYPREQNLNDESVKKEFLADEKEISEHIMLIDLERNDLSRFCEYGSVKVDQLMSVETYSHLHHIVTTISGKLKPFCDQFDAYKNMAPGGTITGCPKLRTMEIIRELEPTPRGPYTGSIGFFGFNGDCNFNIIIRTLILLEKDAYLHVGGGIVFDSDPSREYFETFWKAHAIIKALGHDPEELIRALR